MLISTLNQLISGSKDHIIKSLALFIQHQLLKSVLNGKSVIPPEQLKIDMELVYKIFEQNCIKGQTLLATIASGLLADMIGLN